MGKEKLNQLLALSIGELREKIAYEDAEDTVQDWLDWAELDNDAYEEEEEDDEEISLPYDEEVLAQDIAGDIAAGKYTIEAVQGLYAPVFIDRVRQLVD